LIIPHCDAPPALDFTEHIFNFMALYIERFIVFYMYLAVSFGGHCHPTPHEVLRLSHLWFAQYDGEHPLCKQAGGRAVSFKMCRFNLIWSGTLFATAIHASRQE